MLNSQLPLSANDHRSKFSSFPSFLADVHPGEQLQRGYSRLGLFVSVLSVSILRDMFADMDLDGSFLSWSNIAELVAVSACFVAGPGSAVDFVSFAADVFFDTTLADLVVSAAAFDERFTVVLRTFLSEHVLLHLPGPDRLLTVPVPLLLTAAWDSSQVIVLAAFLASVLPRCEH
jgi:hypothetical protein